MEEKKSMYNEDLELLSAYLDGEVNSEELNRVNELLATSADARFELENLAKVRDSTAATPRVAAPPDLLADLLRQAALRKQSRPVLAPRAAPLRWVWAGSF